MEKRKRTLFFKAFCFQRRHFGKRKEKRKTVIQKRKKMASTPPRKEEEEEEEEWNSFPRQFDEKRSSKEMNFKIDEGNGVVQAIFPLGPTPLTFFPPFTFEKYFFSFSFLFFFLFFFSFFFLENKQFFVLLSLSPSPTKENIFHGPSK